MSTKPSGLAQLKKGFCFDREHDEAFALGWPHIRRLTDDDDVDVARVAAQHLLSTDFDLGLTWNRRVAAALTHAWGVGALFDFAPAERYFRKAAKGAMTETSVPDRSQVESYLSERLRRSPLWASERATRSFVLLLEALTETEWVVSGILDELESMDPDSLTNWATQPAWITFQLGYLLLRLDAAKAQRARVRMERLVDDGLRWLEATDAPHDTPSHLRSLRLVLNGSEATEALTDREVRWYAHATDRPEKLAEQLRRHRGGAMPDVRLAWIAGADVLSSRTFRRWPPLGIRDHAWFQSCIAPIKHEWTAIYMADMMVKSAVKDSAKEWLVDHRAFALASLESMTDHAPAKAAVQMLS